MDIDLFTYEGSLDDNPDIRKLESRVFDIAKAQIDAEAPPGSFEGQRYIAMIHYRELVLLKKMDVASFVVKARVIAYIEKHNLWAAFEGYKSSEEAAAVEADISPSEYSNMKDLWTFIIPYCTQCGISLEELLTKKGANLRMCIPILKNIAVNQLSSSKRVNLRIEQMEEEIRKIAESRNEIVTAKEVRKQMAENILVLMDGTNQDLRKGLDPYAPENARENDPVNSQYPCLIIPQNKKKYIVVEVDQDGLNEFMPFLQKRCVVDHVMSGDNPKTYPLVKKLFGFLESNGQQK
jgi:hypothetical protein